MLQAGICQASITLYAPAQDGATASLYYGSTVYDQVAFSGGIATLDTSSLAFNTPWRVDYSYDADVNWQGRVYTKSGGSYGPVYSGWGGGSMSITSVVGAVTHRSYDFSDPSKRRISVTYQGATGGAVTLADMNNDDFQLDATLNLYRPSIDDIGELSGAVTKPWDPTQLEAGYTHSIVGTAANSGLDMIEVSDGGDFLHTFLGAWNADFNRYDIYFTQHDTADDTAYWSTFDNDGGSEAGVVDNLDGSFTFTSTAVGAFTALDESSAYYVFMDRALAFDGSSDQGGLTSGFDAQHTDLTAAVPEPAVLLLVLGGGGMILVVRRFFMT